MNPAMRRAHKAELLCAPNASLTQRLLDAGQGRLCIIDIAPELPGALSLIKQFAGSVRFSIAHTTCSYNQAMEALDARSGFLHPPF